MTTFAHPFIDHPNTIDVPSDRIKDVEEIYDW